MENEFKKELNDYKILIDTITLIGIIRRNYSDRFTVNYLNKKLLSNLEELNFVPIRATIGSLLDYKEDYEDFLLKKYSNFHERRTEILDVDSSLYDLESDRNEKYSLIQFFGSDSFSWWNDLLSSKISVDNKVDILYDILRNTWDYELFLKCFGSYDSSKEVFDYINDNPAVKTKFYYNLSSHVGALAYLQSNGYVNFDSISEDDDSYYYLTALVNEDHTLPRSFEVFFERLSLDKRQEAFHELFGVACKNVFGTLELLDLNFDLNESIIERLSSYVLNNHDYIEKHYGYENYRQKISAKLIEKTSNVEEKKDNSKFVEEFLDKTDYQKKLERIKLEQQQIDLKRQELYNVLFNMNEYLQSNVPGKTTIGDVYNKKR